jgi:hypothetical protein
LITNAYFFKENIILEILDRRFKSTFVKSISAPIRLIYDQIVSKMNEEIQTDPPQEGAETQTPNGNHKLEVCIIKLKSHNFNNE